jgi:hypothetical protein
MNPIALPVHSKLGASQYDRWGKSLGGCPGSVRLSEGVEKRSSEYADAGTKAHELAYAMLMGQPYTSLVDLDEQSAVDMYVDYVDNCAIPGENQNSIRLLEHRFDLSKYYPNLYGTADCVVYWKKAKKLRVIDYKHGAGIPVEVEENSQLMYYGLGAMATLGYPVTELELAIVQPRCHHPDGPIRLWKTTPARVFDFLADLIDDAKATEDPNAPLNPGDHCRWCPAKPTCPALHQKSRELAAREFSSVKPYDPKELANTLNMLPVMETWIKGVREFAYREAEQGRCPPGWKLVDKRATRKWREPLNQDNLARELGLKNPEIFDTKLKSPAQVERLLSKPAKAIFDQYVVAESSGKTLVATSDKRPEAKERAVAEFDSLVD